MVKTLESLQAGGPSAVPWQQAELAMHLVYSFGELTKSEYDLRLSLTSSDHTRAAFFEVPVELTSKAGRDRARRISINRTMDDGMSSGRTTPIDNDESENGGPHGVKDRIDYTQYPLTPLGQLLSLCTSSGISSYPHPGVTLQYFEIAVRYIEFWKSKDELIQPLFEALLDQR